MTTPPKDEKPIIHYQGGVFYRRVRPFNWQDPTYATEWRDDHVYGDHVIIPLVVLEKLLKEAADEA